MPPPSAIPPATTPRQADYHGDGPSANPCLRRPQAERHLPFPLASAPDSLGLVLHPYERAKVKDVRPDSPTPARLVCPRSFSYKPVRTRRPEGPVCPRLSTSPRPSPLPSARPAP